MILRRVARLMLSSMFVTGGLDAVLNPRDKASVAEDLAHRVTSPLPSLRGMDTEQLIRLNGAVQLAAGVMLALGRLPRLSAAALAASLVPTTVAGHPFWEETDKGQRRAQQIHFLKNVSMLGGLILAALDTEGRPGITWRTRHAVEHVGAAAHRGRREAERSARLASKAAAATARAKLAA